MSFIDFLDWVGRATTLLFLITLVAGVIAWGRGILPALLRLGNGLAKRKIAIFAKSENLGSLESILLDSSLFNKKNLIGITSPNDLDRAEQATLFLVYWRDWKDSIEKIVEAKKYNTVLVVYAPQDEGRIADDKMALLNSKRNVVLANFRGRLLNDVIVSLISTN